MRPKTKKSSHRYLVILGLLLFYVASLVIAAIKYHVDIVWLFYGLIPSVLSVYVALHAWHESHYRDIHTDRIVHQIASDMSDVKSYVSAMAGIAEETKEFDA